MNNTERKAKADQILYQFGLLKKLEEIGKTHIIGSYKMDMMAWNDLDIDIENDIMSLDKLYELSTFIINSFHPVWYEAKEELNDDGKRVWFHGFETMITGELWNVDLWFFDKETILDTEKYCDDIARNTNQMQKDIIVSIKSELISRGLYSFEQYKSIDVYKAVVEYGVKNIDEFLSNQDILPPGLTFPAACATLSSQNSAKSDERRDHHEEDQDPGDPGPLPERQERRLRRVPDLLPVRLQDQLRRGQPEVREDR